MLVFRGVSRCKLIGRYHVSKEHRLLPSAVNMQPVETSIDNTAVRTSHFIISVGLTARQRLQICNI
jgi:hypothetical protein